MCNLFKKKSSDPKSINNTNVPSISMDNMLTELCKYGTPKLVKMESGWWCFVEVSGSALGTQLTIGSDIRHAQAIDAVSECLRRLKASKARLEEH